MIANDSTVRMAAKWALRVEISSLATARFDVRFMLRSMSRSMIMLYTPAAPADM